jgi:hypothetical protein
VSRSSRRGSHVAEELQAARSFAQEVRGKAVPERLQMDGRETSALPRGPLVDKEI